MTRTAAGSDAFPILEPLISKPDVSFCDETWGTADGGLGSVGAVMTRCRQSRHSSLFGFFSGIAGEPLDSTLWEYSTATVARPTLPSIGWFMMVQNFVKTLIKSLGASGLGSFSTPTVEGSPGSLLAEREDWAKWGQVGSFARPAVAFEISALAVAEQEGWAKWGQLGSFESSAVACRRSASAIAEREGWEKWGQLGSFNSTSCLLSPVSSRCAGRALLPGGE